MYFIYYILQDVIPMIYWKLAEVKTAYYKKDTLGAIQMNNYVSQYIAGF